MLEFNAGPCMTLSGSTIVERSLYEPDTIKTALLGAPQNVLHQQPANRYALCFRINRDRTNAGDFAVLPKYVAADDAAIGFRDNCVNIVARYHVFE
jgi:hypothetical protein